MRSNRGFTLIELLISLAIIALLIGIVVPALSMVRRRANTVACLSNLHNIQQAHFMYMTDNKGLFVDVGLGHGGSDNETLTWVNTLQKYYATPLLLRSPADISPHWPADVPGGGVPVPGSTNRFRRTSYGRNNYVTRSYSPPGAIDPAKAADRLSRVPDPAATVDFLIMAFEGEFAGSDHVHVEEWWDAGLGPNLPPVQAAKHVQTNAHGGQAKSWTARSNYGFLDGHSENASFAEVYRNPDYFNRFDPEIARFAAVRQTQ